MAVMSYDILTGLCHWRYQGLEFVTPFGSPWPEYVNGVAVARIEAVRRHAR